MELALVVIPVISGGIGAGVIHEQAAEIVRDTIGLRLVTQEELFVTAGEGARQRTIECGADVDCLTSELHGLGADLGLVVVASEEIDPPLIALRLFDTRARRLIASESGSLVEKDVPSAVRLRSRRMLDGAGYRQAAYLTVRPDPPHAAIALSPHASEKETHTFRVAPGRYTAHASAEGHRAGELSVDVAAGQRIEISLALEREQALVETWWFWSIIAGAVVVIGAGTAVAVSVASDHRRVCIEPCQ